jgi:hypothetical protein
MDEQPPAIERWLLSAPGRILLGVFILASASVALFIDADWMRTRPGWSALSGGQYVDSRGLAYVITFIAGSWFFLSGIVKLATR